MSISGTFEFLLGLASATAILVVPADDQLSFACFSLALCSFPSPLTYPPNDLFG